MRKLGKFEIIEKVGQGAMGVVYKARDPFIDRIVALKTLTTGLADDANLLKRFYSEARSAGGLQHPNIVTIYELGHEGDTPFIAMQFLTGESLDKILDRRPNLPLSQKIGFIVYVCRALEYAHKQNPPVVHRDIKPGNVMVTAEGAVLVVDFGIARLGEGTRSQSAGMLIGTLGYMSPQLFRNGTADARSDIWATGVMFYELLAYRRPFEGDNAAALMSNIILEKPRSIADAAPSTPQDVQAVLERMLAKEAEARYQNMEEVLLELEPIWRRLQQAEVSDLLANSQQLYESGDLENAKAKVSQIIQIDTSNTQAKSLLEKINSEVRRKQVVPQIKARVESAERLLANGQVEEAKAEVEAALKLDSTYQPARQLLGEAQAALERARNIAQALRTSKQRMAEGALTDAELQLDKVLEIDPGNAAAREQLKQIREERCRRERRKQRDEVLHRARTFWTNLQYEECISLLITAQKQFPGDSEITKLLESARQDQAEQQHQSLLTEARNLLNAQQFDDSLRALDLLLERYPSDATAKNLRTHALQGRNQQRRDQKLAEGKSKLQSWVKEGKYTEAIAHAGQLSKEFPDDFELKELLDFARTELSQVEQKHHLEQSSKQIQQALKDGRFFEAIQSAEKALLEFPKNLDLLILLDRARKEQSEKERHEILKQRLREVERMVDRQELTDAIDLARQTLATVGQDSRLADTLLKAERELEFREQRKRQQNDTVQMAETLLKEGNFAGATSVLKGAIETQLLAANDPRLTQLLNEIAAKKEPPPPPPSSALATAAAASGVGPSATLLGSPISSKPTADPGKDYVYQRGTPLPAELLPSERDAVASAFSPTIITGPSAQPVPPPAPPPVRPATEKKEKKKRGPESTPAPVDASATQMFSPTATPEEVSSQLFAPEIDVEPPAVDKRPVRPSPPRRTIEPSPQPIPRPLWKNPLVVAALGIVLIASLGVLVYFNLRPTKVEQPVISKVDQAAWDQAEQLLAASPRRFAEALTRYQSLVTNKSLGPRAQERIQEIEGLQKQESDWMERGAQAQGDKKYDEALKDFEQAKQINGDHEKDAEVAIEVIGNLAKGKTLAEIAQENFKQADRLAAQKQWAAAKSRYQQVQDATDAPPDLRSSAADKMAKVSAHIEEEDLWTRAKVAHGNHENESAKQLAQQVVAKRLDHRAEAQALLQQIDRELNGAVEAASEERRFLDLKQQFESARTTSSVADLSSLQAKFQAVAGAGGKHADEARQIADLEIPKVLNDIDARNRRDQQEKLWSQLVGEYKTALEVDNRTARQSVKDRLSPFLNGSHAPEAQQYVKRLDELMKAEPPKTTPTVSTNPAATPADDPKPAIAKVFDDLSRAFGDRSIEEVRQSWPVIGKQTASNLEASFKFMKSFSRKFMPTNISVTGDTANVTGNYAGAIVNGSASTASNGSFAAALRKQGNRWVITDLKM
jgi:serine/threonine-protein kinase